MIFIKGEDMKKNAKSGRPASKVSVNTPVQAIHKFCTRCVGDNPFIVKDCGGNKCLNGGCDKNGVCWFYKYRLGKGRPSVKTIRKLCLWCQGGSSKFVEECPEGDCPLYSYRMGRNPNFSADQAKHLRKTG
jgi:hypothetical protein